MEEELKKIAVSERTFQKIGEEMLEHLKKEHVQIIVVPNDMIHERLMLFKHEQIDLILLSPDEKAEEIAINKEQAKQKIFELPPVTELPEIDVKDCYLPKPEKIRPYVPRNIGRPCPHKKGGR